MVPQNHAGREIKLDLQTRSVLPVACGNQQPAIFALATCRWSSIHVQRPGPLGHADLQTKPRRTIHVEQERRASGARKARLLFHPNRAVVERQSDLRWLDQVDNQDIRLLASG